MTGRDFPLPLPTPRCAWLVAACALPVAAGTFVPAVGWFGAVCAALVLVAALVDWMALPRAAEMAVERVERTAFSHGAEETLSVDVRSRRVVTVRVLDDLPDGIERVADPARAALVPGEIAQFSTRVRAAKRGAFRLSTVNLRVASRWGLAEREMRFDLPAEIRVYPGIRAVAQSARYMQRSRHDEHGLRRSRRRGEGTSFESLREYVRGEDPRRMDWKASARHAKLITRQYEVERNQSVMLLVDCGRWMTSEVEGMTRLDHVLEACVLLAHVAASRGDRVGLLAFADEVLAYVPPSKGRAAVERILAATFEIEPRLVESDYAGAFAQLAARHRKRSLLVLFTDVLSKDASRAVVDECVRSVRRHLPLAVTLRDAGLEALAQGVPANAAAVYRQAASEELLLERDQALAVMKRAGIQVVDVAPKSLGPAVVDRYLEIKSRMLV